VIIICIRVARNLSQFFFSKRLVPTGTYELSEIIILLYVRYSKDLWSIIHRRKLDATLFSPSASPPCIESESWGASTVKLVKRKFRNLYLLLVDLDALILTNQIIYY